MLTGGKAFRLVVVWWYSRRESKLLSSLILIEHYIHEYTIENVIHVEKNAKQLGFRYKAA